MTLLAHAMKSSLSLSFKFGLAFLILGAVAIFNALVVGHLMDEQNGIADTIGVAGRLRMLSQKQAAGILLSLREPAKQAGLVAADIAEFEAGLDAVEKVAWRLATWSSVRRVSLIASSSAYAAAGAFIVTRCKACCGIHARVMRVPILAA
jgi:hypothetical protein